MTDPQAFLNSLFHVDVQAALKMVLVGATTYLSVWGISRVMVRLQRGKRLGPALRTTTTRKPGPVLAKLKLRPFAEKFVLRLIDVGAYAVFAYFTYTTFLKIELPLQPWSAIGLSALACLNLWWYVRSQSGRCVVFRNGLLLDGVFYKEKRILSYTVGEGTVDIETKGKVFRLSGRSVAMFKNTVEDIELKMRIEAKERALGPTPLSPLP